jgi:PST family polysaccharide transporter
MSNEVVEGVAIGSVARRGAFVTAAGQLIKLIAQCLSLVVLSRLLTPSDFGVVGMVMALVTIGEVVRDFGLSYAAVQARDLTSAQRSNLFWTNWSIGILLAASVVMSAPLVASFYGRPELISIVQLLALVFVANGFATQFRADLLRRLQFGAIAIADVLAQSVGLAAALILAMNGAGYWALVYQQLGQSAICAVLLAGLSRQLFGRPSRKAGMGPLIRYGTQTAASQMIAYLSRNVDSIAVGRGYGPEALGLYDRAFQLLMLPLNQLSAPATSVAVPILSRLQDDRDRYCALLVKAQTLLLYGILTVVTGMFVLADVLVPLVFGPQWVSSIAPFRVLAVGGFFQAAGYVSYWVYLSRGLARRNLFQTVLGRGIVIVLVIAGSNFGVLGIAAGYSLGLAICWPLGFALIGRGIAPRRLLCVNGARAVGVFLVSGVVAYEAIVALSIVSSGISIVVGVVAMFGTISLLCAISSHVRRDVLTVLSLSYRAAGKLR